MLARSQDAPISIRADVIEPNGVNDWHAVAIALPHAARASEFTLRCHTWPHMSTLLASAHTPGPLLTALRLLGPPEKFEQASVVPPAFFASAAPWSLRTLELARLKLPPGVLPRHCVQLTHLALQAVGPLTLDDVLAAVGAAATTLETLSLQHLPLQPPSAADVWAVTLPPTAVATPRLAFVHVDCAFADARANAICALLPLLTLPPHTSVSVQLLLAGFAFQSIPPAALGALAAHASAGPPLRSLLLSQGRVHMRKGVRVHAWTAAVPPAFFDDEPPPPKLAVLVVREQDADAAQMHRALLELAAALPLASVQALTLARLPGATPALLDALFARVPALRELTVHGSAALRALCDGGALGALPPAAALSVYEAAGSADFGALRRALDARSRRGRRVPRLVVCYSDVRRAEIEALAKLVDEIVWDGSIKGTEGVPIPVEEEVQA
ncbi:hypothetical protein BV25DRAFT_1830221 [Artomyces pyxidatus]|uniref:Uncharacterized protein n=1 Tax=Artomyces pyxidatus TaxID=48021 RepID=A0ACB8SPF5_9AGAM|nr:hypothetical protein BV25DRAFT_1830221 [Artomyces pyxidatus]